MIKITENMRKILFFLVVLFCTNVALAQEIKGYYTGNVVSGSKYTYRITKIYRTLYLENSADIKYVTINGEEHYITSEFGSFLKLNNPNIVIEAIEAVFSKEEILEMAKACIEFKKSYCSDNFKTSFFYSFDPDVDKNGKIVNLSISFKNCDVMRNVPPQKIEQLEDYIKKNAVYTIKSKEFAERLQIISAQPIEVDVNNTDYSFELMYDTNKY